MASDILARLHLGVTYSTPPLAEMAIDCRSTDMKTFQQAKRAGLITRDARTEPGYLDQIAVIPAWYNITIEQKRGLVHVASCVLSEGVKGLQVFDARNGREIAQ